MRREVLLHLAQSRCTEVDDAAGTEPCAVAAAVRAVRKARAHEGAAVLGVQIDDVLGGEAAVLGDPGRHALHEVAVLLLGGLPVPPLSHGPQPLVGVDALPDAAYVVLVGIGGHLGQLERGQVPLVDAQVGQELLQCGHLAVVVRPDHAVDAAHDSQGLGQLQALHGPVEAVPGVPEEVVALRVHAVDADDDQRQAGLGERVGHPGQQHAVGDEADLQAGLGGGAHHGQDLPVHQRLATGEAKVADPLFESLRNQLGKVLVREPVGIPGVGEIAHETARVTGLQYADEQVSGSFGKRRHYELSCGFGWECLNARRVLSRSAISTRWPVVA